MAQFIETLIDFQCVEILAILSLFGLYSFTQRVRWGLWLVLAHVIICFPVSAGIKNPTSEERLLLGLFTAAPGLMVLLYDAGLATYKVSKALLLRLQWHIRLFTQKTPHTRALKAYADKVGGDVTGQQLTLPLSHDQTLLTGFRVHKQRGYTSFVYTSENSIPALLELVSTNAKGEIIDEESPLFVYDHAGKNEAPEWLLSFRIEPQWRPFSSLGMETPRSFGEVIPGYAVRGPECDVLAACSQNARELLRQCPPDAHVLVRDGELSLQLPGFVPEQIEPMSELVIALGRELSRRASPERFWHNLQDETEELLQVRLLEYLLGTYRTTDKAERAHQWTIAQEGHVFRLLEGMFKGAEGASMLEQLALDTEASIPLRRAAWSRLLLILPQEPSTALLRSLLAQENTTFAIQTIKVLIAKPSLSGCQVAREWLERNAVPYSTELEETFVRLYQKTANVHTEACALGLLLRTECKASKTILEIANEQGTSTTFGVLHRVAYQLASGGGGQWTKERLKQTQKVIQHLQLRLGPQELGQLSLPELDDTDGSLSLATESEGQLSLSHESEGGEMSISEEMSPNAASAENPI